MKLLCRIEAPAYLHSGVKGRSYLSNSKQHIGRHQLAKIDIRKFFPSTTFRHIYRGFAKTFKCSRDIAYLIAKLCTVENHLPTGSPISCIVAYYAHKEMFDTLFRIAEDRGWILTCYVDDITISGEGINDGSLTAIKKVVTNAGLACNDRKERVYSRYKPKLVTGNIVDATGIRLPHRRQKAIYDGLSRLRVESDPEVRSKLVRELTGRVNEAAQVDISFRNKLRWFKQTLAEASAQANL